MDVVVVVAVVFFFDVGSVSVFPLVVSGIQLNMNYWHFVTTLEHRLHSCVEMVCPLCQACALWGGHVHGIHSIAVLPRCCVCQWFTLNSCNCFLNKDYRTISSPKTFWATQYIWWRYSCRNPNTHGKIGGRLASPISKLPLRNHTSADCSVSCERVDRKVLVHERQPIISLSQSIGFS